MYSLAIIFTLLGTTGNFTITGFDSQEECYEFYNNHKEPLVPYIEGYFKVPLDSTIDITSVICKKDTI